jgi:hypothetical protein
MEFNQLFEMQRELDRFIEETQNVEKDVFKEKGLALFRARYYFRRVCRFDSLYAVVRLYARFHFK